MALRCRRHSLGIRLAVALALVCASPVVAHDPIRFDTRRPMPGTSLAIVEVSRAAAPAVSVKYRLQAAGVPRGLVMGVWANEFGHGYHQLVADVRVDESGALVSTELDATGRPLSLDQMTFEPGPLPRGAGWEVAIVGPDRKVVAYAKVVPRPIVGRAGPCTVSLELASRRGDRFIASGTGFVPGEEVIIEVAFAGKAIRKTQRVLPDGLLSEDIFMHEGSGSPADTSGARYAVKSRSCDVAVEYEWGKRALSTR